MCMMIFIRLLFCVLLLSLSQLTYLHLNVKHTYYTIRTCRGKSIHIFFNFFFFLVFVDVVEDIAVVCCVVSSGVFL